MLGPKAWENEIPYPALADLTREQARWTGG